MPRRARRPSCVLARTPRRGSGARPTADSSRMPAPGMSASRRSSITSRTTMSQRSSGSPRTAVTEDERLLQIPPDERRTSFTHTDPWRVLRIMGEFVEGFDTLSDVRNAVTVFGSARTKPGGPYYEKAVETRRLLAPGGFAVITGGG